MEMAAPAEMAVSASMTGAGRMAEARAADPDTALMALIARGDREAFARLMDRHLRYAVNAAFRVLLNPHDAEEVAQEAFLRVWHHAARWQPDGPARFRTWLTRIVVNLSIDRKRRPGMEALDDQIEPADPSPGPYDHRLASETERRVAQALARLPERQRAALVLCFWDEESNIEAAATLGISVGALESLLIRAKRSLRQSLSPDFAPATGNPQELQT